MRQEHVRDVSAEQMEEQNIPDRKVFSLTKNTDHLVREEMMNWILFCIQEHDRPQPAKRRRKTDTLKMDYEQTIITGPEYQSWLQNTSNILMSGKKRKVQISELMLA